ncbi:hypothetical protein J6590_026093 [Homalodisca vitripennis]|nr:hypothetical protein J6590_026093 [Homalodisca vitripennis]
MDIPTLQQLTFESTVQGDIENIEAGERSLRCSSSAKLEFVLCWLRLCGLHDLPGMLTVWCNHWEKGRSDVALALSFRWYCADCDPVVDTIPQECWLSGVITERKAAEHKL